MALPNGDLVTTVFNPQMAYPLDKRMQIDTINARDSLSMYIRWEGMTVYVLEDSNIYILKGGISNEYWQLLGSGSGGSGGSTFVGQFPTVEDLPTTGRSPGNYAFVGTDDNFSQYNWDNIAGRWVKNELKLPVGAEGQILKVKENGSSEYIVADPLVFGNFITNDEELEDAKSYIVTPSEVFNSWFRFSHGVGYGGSDTSYIVKSDLVPGMPLQTNSWLYDSGNDVVRSTMNASSFLGFVNNDNVTYYNLSTTISASGSDSDRVGVVLCFIEDKTDMIGNNAYGMDEGDFSWDIDVENELIPNQHTLTVFRNRKYVGNGIPPYDYFVVYNYGKLDEKVIAVNLDPWRGSTTSFAWDGNSFDISIVRAGDQISILVSDFSDAPGGKGSLRFPINIDLSSDPDLYKFRGGARFGVCCQSQQNTSFSELNFSNSDNDILDLRNGNVWVLDGSEHVISPDRNVYNEVPAKSYFYSRRYGTFGFINSAIGDYLILNRDISQQEVNTLSLEYVNHISIPYGTPQIITRSTGDEALIREIGNVVFDKNTNLWVLTYTGTTTPYVEDECWVYWATSPDLKTWTKKGKCTGQGAEDPYLVIQGGTYYLFVEHKDLSHPSGHAGVGLWKGTSMETLTFQGVVLEAGESGWDSGDVSSPTIIYDDNTWYMFYEGRSEDQRGAIGLATSTTLDGEWIKVTENEPMVAGTQYDPNSPVQWAYSIVPDDIIKIGERYYLSFHAESNNSYVTSIIASESLTEGWFDLIGTWFTKDITGSDVNGAGFMFVKTDGKIRTIANQGTGIYLCDLTNKSIDNWYYRTVPQSAFGPIYNIAGGNRNEIIQFNLNTNKEFGWRSNKAGKAGVVKKIVNKTNFTLTLTPESGVRINNSTSPYVVQANTIEDFVLTAVDRWEVVTSVGTTNMSSEYFELDTDIDGNEFITIKDGSIGEDKLHANVVSKLNYLVKPLASAANANYTLSSVENWTSRFWNFTGTSGNLTIDSNVFSANDQFEGVVTGGAKTLVAGSGFTLRIPAGGSPTVNQYERFALKFLSPTEAVLNIIKPSGSSTVPDASTTEKGIIELATQTEVNTGTDSVRAVTPATLQTKLNNFTPTMPNASTTRRGIIEQATDAETITGTDTERSVSPANLQAKLDAFATYGTYTPIINSSGTNPTLTYVTQYGAWRKIGRLMQFEARIEWNGKVNDGTGNIGISLPSGRDISESNHAYIGGLSIGMCSGITVTNGITATFIGASTGVRFFNYDGGSIPVTALKEAGILLISGSYKTSS